MNFLIVGGESDPNTQRVVDQVHIRGHEYMYWDTDQSSCLDIAWDFKQPDLDLGDQRIRPSAIFMRWNVFGGDSQKNLAAYETIQAYSFAWPDVKVLNRRTITDINNKSYNLRLAQEVGFKIPESLVMSNLAPLKTMPNAEERIVKPLNGEPTRNWFLNFRCTSKNWHPVLRNLFRRICPAKTCDFSRSAGNFLVTTW